MLTYTIKGTVTDSVVVRVATGPATSESLAFIKDTKIVLFVATEDNLATQAQRYSEAARGVQLRNDILEMIARYRRHQGAFGGTGIADRLWAILYPAQAQRNKVTKLLTKLTLLAFAAVLLLGCNPPCDPATQPCDVDLSTRNQQPYNAPPETKWCVQGAAAVPCGKGD